ncbi:hypothetical protein G9A89_003567 [Geosiphon pyriformis]|nr:hypothetical protein G9A89_003567 [Geosiphon pyriformis]
MTTTERTNDLSTSEINIAPVILTFNKQTTSPSEVSKKITESKLKLDPLFETQKQLNERGNLIIEQVSDSVLNASVLMVIETLKDVGWSLSNAKKFIDHAEENMKSMVPRLLITKSEEAREYYDVRIDQYAYYCDVLFPAECEGAKKSMDQMRSNLTKIEAIIQSRSQKVSEVVTRQQLARASTPPPQEQQIMKTPKPVLATPIKTPERIFPTSATTTPQIESVKKAESGSGLSAIFVHGAVSLQSTVEAQSPTPMKTQIGALKQIPIQNQPEMASQDEDIPIVDLKQQEQDGQESMEQASKTEEIIEPMQE